LKSCPSSDTLAAIFCKKGTSAGNGSDYQIAATANKIKIIGWCNKTRIAYSIKNNTATDNDKKAILTEMNLIGLIQVPVEVYADKIIGKAQAFSNATVLLTD
jgi:hypothetical protein